MSWIRFAVAGIALCAGASVASAQGGPPAGAPPMGGMQGQQGGPGGRRGGMQAMLLVGITLTDVQQKKVDEIRAKYRTQMQAMMPNGMQGGPPDPSMRAKMTEMQEHQTHDIREILTDDQRKIFDVNVAEQKKRREEMMKQRQG
ncbi:MAG TPA: Spy/CpxP family protein refolding chaperone [Gemmatimonadaceae bacterium]|nr:Spy/CpxP family protein refolding chaperone [Gemmatimonadaceae bacterium]